MNKLHLLWIIPSTILISTLYCNNLVMNSCEDQFFKAVSNTECFDGCIYGNKVFGDE